MRRMPSRFLAGAQSSPPEASTGMITLYIVFMLYGLIVGAALGAAAALWITGQI